VTLRSYITGHISIYIPEDKILIAGDAVVWEDCELDIANPGFTLDMASALASVKRLSGLAIDRLYCYH
jgi:glyoxylase-like metal-dependent hydrolase (beta-lactamase superfamily II)